MTESTPRRLLRLLAELCVEAFYRSVYDAPAARQAAAEGRDQ